MYCHADVTAVFPWLTYALLSDPKLKRRPRRLYDARGAAVSRLQREVQTRTRELEKTIAYPLARAAGQGQKRGKAGRPAAGRKAPASRG
jgi:deoxyhypusine synthase